MLFVMDGWGIVIFLPASTAWFPGSFLAKARSTLLWCLIVRVVLLGRETFGRAKLSRF